MMAKTHAPLSAAIGGGMAFAYMNAEALGSAWRTATGNVANKFVIAVNEAMHSMSWTAIGVALLVTLVIGGYALAPDLDEPGSTIAKKTGPVGAVVSPVVRVIAGGHRKGTHSIIAIAALSALGWYGSQNIYSWVAIAVFGCYLSVALVTGTNAWWAQVGVALGIGAVAYVTASDITPEIGAAVVGGGALLHVLEDMMTTGKVAVLWPVPVKIGLGLFDTDGAVENSVIYPLANILVTVVLVVAVALPTLMHVI